MIAESRPANRYGTRSRSQIKTDDGWTVALAPPILGKLGGLGGASREPTPEVWRLVDW